MCISPREVSPLSAWQKMWLLILWGQMAAESVRGCALLRGLVTGAESGFCSDAGPHTNMCAHTQAHMHTRRCTHLLYLRVQFSFESHHKKTFSPKC